MHERDDPHETALIDDGAGDEPEGDFDSYFPADSDFGERPPLRAEPTLLHCAAIEHEGEEHPVLGRYVLLEKLGQGGMGAVFRAQHQDLGSEVAIKVLLPGIVARLDDVVERFFDEAQIAAGLDSDYLVHVLGVATDEPSGAHYMVMELVEGTTAEEWLQIWKGASETAALDLAIAATRGLAAAHRAGLVHRDVKPANILLPHCAEDQPVPSRAQLTDHGLARPVRGVNTLSRGRVGLASPGYMAPEQGQDKQAVGKPADVFAMGASLYAFLVGHAPFQGQKAFDVLAATARGEYARLSEVRPDVSAATCEVVDRCLSVRPADRYPDAPTLLQALEACREPSKKKDVWRPGADSVSEGPAARQRAWAEAPRRSDGGSGFVGAEELRRRRRIRNAVTAVVGVLLLGAVVVAKIGIAPPPAPEEVVAQLPAAPRADAVAWVVGATGGFQFDDETVLRAPEHRRPLVSGAWVASESSQVTVKLHPDRDVRLELTANSRLRMAEGGPLLEEGSASLLAGKVALTLAQGATLTLGEFTARVVGGEGRIVVERNSLGRGVDVEAGERDIELAIAGRTCRVPAGCTFSLVRGARKAPTVVLGAGRDNPAAVTMRIERDGATAELEFPAGARCVLRDGAAGLSIMHLMDSVATEAIRSTIRSAPNAEARSLAIQRGGQEQLF